MSCNLLKALLSYVILQIVYLFGHCFDSFSEGEIIPFSGVSKSGAGSIAHAAGAGRSVRGASGVDVQPTLAIANTTLHIIKLLFRIGQFLRVFGIQRSDITLASLHVFDGGIRQAEILSDFIALVFVGEGVIAVVVNRPSHRNQQADNESADNCG